MSHLDEGQLTAMLDGEIPSGELAPIRGHLEACAECRTLLEELRGLMGEADTLITSLGDGTTGTAARAQVLPMGRASRSRSYRLLAWAATVVMAAGLGYWARGPGVAPMGELSDGATRTPPGVALEDRSRNSQAVAPVESAGADRAAAPPAGRRAESAADASPAVPPPAPVVVEDAPAALGRAAARTDAGAAKVAERLVTEPEASARASALRGAAGAPAAAPVPVAREATRQEVAVESFVPISFVDAVARMGGTLRLVDGLVPDRLEASTATVRVIYPLQAGELVLEQRRVGDSISVTLRGPVSADSLAVLRGRVR